jgi:hypothetical protein
MAKAALCSGAALMVWINSKKGPSQIPSLADIQRWLDEAIKPGIPWTSTTQTIERHLRHVIKIHNNSSKVLKEFIQHAAGNAW